MHTFSETGAGVPAFLAKLWRLVEDQETNHLIYWSKDGRSFIIQNQAQFARELLPLNYKHNNMASFIRQLNMYGFHKITSIDNGGLKFDRDEMEFTHPYFKRGCPYLLEHIKRKIAHTKQHQQLIDDKDGIKIESVSKVLNEVKVMRGRQDSLDSRFSVMKQENEALWREIATLRQKHIKQQQIVNKLIQFLVTIVQPSRNMTGVKRNFQLMINDAPKDQKTRSESESEPGGPVIHELTEELLDEVVNNEEDDDDLVSGPPSPHAMTNSSGADHPHIESLSPASNIERPNSTLSVASQLYEQQSNQSYDDAKYFNSSNTNSNNSSNIVYYIREFPDLETNNESNIIKEENVLTTPMVKQELAKAKEQSLLINQKQKQLQQQHQQQHQQQQKQLQKQNQQINTIKQSEHRNSRKRKHIDELPTTEYITQSSPFRSIMDPLKIKTEREQLDPLMFLKTSPSPNNSCNISPAIDPALISPNSNASTSTNGTSGGYNQNIQMKYPNSNTSQSQNLLEVQSNQSETSSQQKLIQQTSTTLINKNNNGNSMYEGDFLNNEMPTDLFEEPSMGCDLNLSPDSSIERQVTTPAPSTSNFVISNNTEIDKSNNLNNENNINQNDNKNDAEKNGNGASSVANDKSSDLAVTKYSTQVSHDDIMKYSTPEDFHSHIDEVQDGLDSLKDLLKSDGYAFDTNTLSSLFNDSDILGQYGLTNLQNDIPGSSKTGSELTAYQPYVEEYGDLTDFLNINEKEPELEEVNSPNISRDDDQGSSSVLNTPRPESRKAPF